MIRWKTGLRHQGEVKTERARVLRKQMTDAEVVLWKRLRNRGLTDMKFRRQVPFGPYILDFYCTQKRVAIELDGGQHFSDEGRLKDFKRDKFLLLNGIRVVRYTDREVLLNLEEVMEDIWNVLTEQKSSPQPSPFQGEGDSLRSTDAKVGHVYSPLLPEREKVGMRVADSGAKTPFQFSKTGVK